MRTLLSIVFIMYACLPILAAYAKGGDTFNLFDPSRGRGVGRKIVPAHSRVTPVKKKKSEQGHFSLRGTAILGEKHVVSLQPPGSKEVISVRWSPKGLSTIPGYDGYMISSVTPRQIEMLYPVDNLCKSSNPSLGVDCQEEGRRAILTLVSQTAAKPRKRKITPTPTSSAQKLKKGKDKKKPNPFIAAVQRAKAKVKKKSETVSTDKSKQIEEVRQKRKERYKNFKPKRIKDEDVPPGMKVVRTPFGDRLVPQE